MVRKIIYLQVDMCYYIFSLASRGFLKWIPSKSLADPSLFCSQVAVVLPTMTGKSVKPLDVPPRQCGAHVMGDFFFDDQLIK